MQAVGFYIYYGFMWVYTLLPTQAIYFLADILFVLVYYVVGYRKKVIEKNLKNSFPDKSEAEIKHITKDYYRHLADNVVEISALIHMSEKEHDKRYQYSNLEIFDELHKKGKNIALVSGHYANWDWLANLHPKIPHKFCPIYKPMKNKYFDKFVNKMRTKYGAEMVPMKQSMKLAISNHKQNIPTALYFLGDQSPTKSKIHFWVKFLNQPTAIYLGVEKIAKKLDWAVVFLDIQKIKRGYYHTDIKLITESGKQTKPYEITRSHMRILENRIKQQPAYWLWSHRRWKHTPEDAKFAPPPEECYKM